MRFSALRSRYVQICSMIAAVVMCFTMHAPTAHANILTPSTYLSFADSPFKADLGNGDFTYFNLEDFEDNLLNTPGVTASTGTIIGPQRGLISDTTSDPRTPGRGLLSVLPNTVITFTFNPSVLGALPTHVGIVRTDGASPITIEAFDSAGNSLGSLTTNDTPVPKRFYGATNVAGISRVTIGNPFGIEVDHLQYGLARSTMQIPTPATLPPVVLGLACIFARRRLPKN